MQIHIWELANEYHMDAEDVRRALSIAGPSGLIKRGHAAIHPVVPARPGLRRIDSNYESDGRCEDLKSCCG
jgi:hypothetical protein